jgi:hypothetical protein
MSDLKELMAERQKLTQQIATTRTERLKTLEELRAIMYDAASFIQSPYKFNKEGYYFFLHFKSEYDEMIKRIVVQKNFVNLDLLTIPEVEFIKIRQIVEDEIRQKYTEQIQKEQAVVNGMK